MLLLPYEDSHLWTRKQTLTRHRICQCLGLRLPSPRTVRNRFLLFKNYSICRKLNRQRYSLNVAIPMVPTQMSTLSLYSLFASVIFLSVVSTAFSIQGDSQFLALCSSVPLCPNLMFSTNLPSILNSTHPEQVHHSHQHTSFFTQFSSFWCHTLRKLEQKPPNVITFTPDLSCYCPNLGQTLVTLSL